MRTIQSTVELAELASTLIDDTPVKDDATVEELRIEGFKGWLCTFSKFDVRNLLKVIFGLRVRKVCLISIELDIAGFSLTDRVYPDLQEIELDSCRGSDTVVRYFFQRAPRLFRFSESGLDAITGKQYNNAAEIITACRYIDLYLQSSYTLSNVRYHQAEQFAQLGFGPNSINSAVFSGHVMMPILPAPLSCT